ncbi:MAG: bifunctional (p)ppGpp synthetase/guanosine-3',5'-bis(diphosphate) 3'-pyrophosphohydrolase [Lachnospiraceae bacterium]|nr:bifunctional (p)ppGpp synthetase/guanosine-3',5'-bis(diphosphate) 3'-pyrophosphohydrolase [Lachnospiraceae bacterium]
MAEEKNDVIFDDGKINESHEFINPEELYQELIQCVQKYHPSDDISMIEKAYRIAYEAHKNQFRKSGEPYIIHPLNVAIILADLELDKETIVAGILHDVVEDTIMTEEDLKHEFGDDVALLVDGVTKLEKIPLSSGTDQPDQKLEMQAENLRKMFLAMAKDIRVIMIKLADRLHNMRTLKYKTPESQQRIARETLEIYCPIAQRLGISKIKIELDDLSLKYLEPEVYYDLVDKIAVRKSVREKYIQGIVDEVREHIVGAGIQAKVDGRVKHFFSIYKKMKNQNKTLDQIYDLFAVRIIVETVRDCYAALGVIHEMYTPIPGRFKDYIAMPKANMYQSLHTTLIGSTGQPFEIQIRTFEMHKAAEYGIAAHWKYKEASDGKKVAAQEEEKLVWLRQILEWQQDMSDNREFLNLLKNDLDLFSDNVYCFTPTGEVKNLPAGSTPIDFAYCIHSAVGNRMVGARVNGKLVTIDYEIKNGDRIEIITSQNSKGPSRDWLNVVKSTQAKNKINQWFKNELKEDNIVKGRELLANYCKTKSINLSELQKQEYMDAIMRKYGFRDWESVLAAIGHGALKEGQIVNRMQELYDRAHQKETTNEEVLQSIAEATAAAAAKPARMKARSGIVVKGIADLSVRFSKCCSPVPGDEIVGFVTRGRGISIHRTDCVNMMNLPEIERIRLIDAEWQEEGAAEKYVAEIKIFANNRNGLLADISKAMTEKNIDILSMNTRVNRQGLATLQTTFEIGGREELNRIIERIRAIESVVDIERTTG